MACVRMLCGSRWSRRTDETDAAVTERWGRSLLLVPTNAAARARTESLLRRGLAGAWGRPVQTFEDFARAFLESAGRPIHLLDNVERRLVFEQVVLRLDADGRLGPAGEAAHTVGFVTHMLRTVAQLKQAAVEPAEFRDRVRERPGASPLDQTVVEVYEAYQGELLRQGLHDRVGLFWDAAQLCGTGCPLALEGVELLALDGYDDFTPSEFRLLEAVAAHVDELLFSLACEPDVPGQRDLYALPLATADAIRARFEPVEERHLEEASPETASHYAARHIFWRDEPPGASGLSPNIAFTPCLDPVHELELVGRRIKRLIVEQGVAPDTVALVHASLRGAAEDVRQAFAEFGLPVHVGEDRSVASSAVGRFALSLFEVFGGWAREPVLDLAASPWFCPPGKPAGSITAAWRPLAKAAKVVAGREEWLARVELLSKRLDEAGDEDAGDETVAALAQRMPGAGGAARSLRSALEKLAAIDDGLPREATIERFADALGTALDELDVAGAFADPPEDGPAPEVLAAEFEAYRALRGTLARMTRTGRYARKEAESPRLDRNRFLRLLRAALSECPCPVQSPRAAIHVMSPDRIRQLEFAHVFLVGANDGVMPAAPAVNAVYGETDIEALGEAGIRLDDKTKHARMQRLLFHHVLAAAGEKLWVSWHTADRSDRAAMPSPFVNELIELFPDGDAVEPPPAAHDFLPRPEEVASSRDLVNAAFTYGLEAPDETHADWFADLRTRARIETERQGPRRFGKYDGVLANPDLVAGIAERFGENHDFSAQQLEEYAQCPFRFFVQRILELRHEPPPSLEFDARLRGTIMHRILERFHRRFLGRPLVDIGIEEAREAMGEVLEKTFDAYARHTAAVPAGALVAEKEQLRRRLERYMYVERASDTDWAPIHLEVSFGPVRNPSTEAPSTPEPFRLSAGSETIRLAGRIDRIDRRAAPEETGRFRIIDYKTSKHGSKKEVMAGELVQLGLYALALEQHVLSEGLCEEARYVPVGYDFKSWTEVLGRCKGGESSKRLSALMRSVKRSVQGIREGRFPPEPAEHACRYCAFKGACRYEAARAERKTRIAKAGEAR